MTTTRTDRIQRWFSDERARVARELDELDERLRLDHWEDSWADESDAGAAMTDREESEAQRNELARRIRDLDDARERLETGVYGICEVCGERIAAGRLDALPLTTVCTRHAS